MRFSLILSVLVFAVPLWAQSQPPASANGIEEGRPPEKGADENQNNSKAGNEPANNPVLVANSLNGSDGDKNFKDGTKQTFPRPSLNWDISDLTFLLVVIGAAQCAAYFWQGFLMRRTLKVTRDAGKEQSETMKISITEANRAANNIADGATNIRFAADALLANAEMAKEMLAKQMRAYLHIDAGHALFQVTEVPFRFQARPLLTNNGFTYARDVQVRIRADIFPNPLPTNAVFGEPYGLEGAWFLGPRQSMTLPADAPALVSEEEIADVKIGKGKILYAWGVVTYKDVNDSLHTLRFCLNYTWIKDGVLGTFIGGRCDST